MHRKIVPLVACLCLALTGFAKATDAWATIGHRSREAIRSAHSESANIAIPAYDSGWESLGVRPDPIPVEFTHNLGGDPDSYLVSLECRDDTSLGTYQCVDQGFNVNALWYDLTDITIRVYAAGGSRPDAVRVRIYTPAPAYDSGWESLGVRPDPIPVEFTHNLGGDPDSYLVSLECRDDTSLGTYQCVDQGFNVKALWYDLTDTTIRVYAAGGSRPDAVRVRIYTPAPAYDSGWDSLGVRPDPIPVPFTHNLGGDPDSYLVGLKCRDDTSLGTYQCVDQEFNVNALWYGLTDTIVRTYATGGSRPDDVRVRIWRASTVYLPIVVRNPNGGG